MPVCHTWSESAVIVSVCFRRSNRSGETAAQAGPDRNALAQCCALIFFRNAHGPHRSCHEIIGFEGCRVRMAQLNFVEQAHGNHHAAQVVVTVLALV